MARNWAMVVAAALLAAWISAAAAADAESGKRLSDASCAACHGHNGIGIIPLYPNLAGQKREYLVAQLHAFRDGTRKNPIMAPMAAHLTDAEIEDVAEYLATLR
ncbi:MAG TPA: cytochrome c [Steroidobacteraceae bacterium]|nr:cytochrome c [Steroidobacteraceae bacterium]